MVIKLFIFVMEAFSILVVFAVVGLVCILVAGH